MCTLIALDRTVPGAPLVVAANRDEYFDRAASGPQLQQTPGGPILAPLDLRAGGTWLGLNPHGVFAAVTNRRSVFVDSDRRSRGQLVLDALAGRTAREGAKRIAEAPEAAFNPFNFFIADTESAFVVTYEDRASVCELEPGVHMVGNGEPDDRNDPKAARILEQAEKSAMRGRDFVLDELAMTCAEHDCGGGPLGDTCVHTPSYGTRSSLLMVLGAGQGDDRLLYADGAPCRTPYQDFTALLPELTQMADYEAGENSARSAI